MVRQSVVATLAEPFPVFVDLDIRTLG